MVLLTLYEFEAKAQLGDSDLAACLDYAEALPHTDPSTFETLAGKQLVDNCHFCTPYSHKKNEGGVGSVNINSNNFFKKHLLFKILNSNGAFYGAITVATSPCKSLSWLLITTVIWLMVVFSNNEW